MSDPYIGEIRMFAGNYPPNGWAFCDGATMPIDQNDALFQLIGTTYGGDGQVTFGLPDLRGRVPIHQGQAPGLSSYVVGQTGGVETTTLTTQQIPAHNHSLLATTSIGQQANPGGNLLANSQGPQPYIQEAPDGNLNPAAMAPSGGSQPHDNLQPFLAINFILSLFGFFPTPS